MEDSSKKLEEYKKYLSDKHDELCAAADKIIAKYNPCEFENGICTRTRRDRPICKPKKFDHYNCCGDYFSEDTDTPCRYLIKGKGCGVNALGCKLSFCYGAKTPPDMLEELEPLIEEAKILSLLGIRLSKEDVLLRITRCMKIKY